MALRITGEPAGADDALQEGLISAYRALDRVEPRNLRGWFVRIVQNAARDALRRERRRPTLSIRSGEGPDSSDERGAVAEPQAGAASDPVLAAERGELAGELAAALEQIPEERRTAILLYDVDGYDYAEIAEITGCSVGTVKSRISRGRGELRRLLVGLRPGTNPEDQALRRRDV
jgi:RNA polymerase sigma-70 factor (ECF subfamily)